jgi:predicted RNA-binding protein with EMAP domain
VGFISKIVDIIKKRGINLRYKHEFSKFFSKFPTAAAVNLDGNLVVTNSAENDWYGLRAQANQLAHEIVHALQDLRYPRMPEEEAEREAYYYQMLTPQQIIKYMEDPEFLDHFVNVVIQDHIEQSCKTNKKI